MPELIKAGHYRSLAQKIHNNAGKGIIPTPITMRELETMPVHGARRIMNHREGPNDPRLPPMAPQHSDPDRTMDELEDMLMEHGIMKPVDEAIVGKTAAELAAEAAIAAA